MINRKYTWRIENLILFPILFFILHNIVVAQPEIPVLKYWATDYSGTLTQDELQYLNQDLINFNDTTSTQIVFLMISTMNDYPLENYSYETAAKNKIGSKANNNGALFVVVKDDRKMRIEVGYGLEGALPDALASSIIRNEVAPYFKRGDYFQGIKAGIDAIKAATVGEYSVKKERDHNKGYKGIGSFLFIIAIIIFSIISRIGRGGRRGGFIFLPGGGMFGGRSGGFGGGGGGGFGGFSGGGGSFGGGGSSGSW